MLETTNLSTTARQSFTRPQKRCRRRQNNHRHLYSRWQRCRPSDLGEVAPYA